MSQTEPSAAITLRRAERVHALAIAAAVASVGPRLFLAWMPIATLVSKTLPDDAFYYFQIARHLVRGDGVTFDGLNVTNGFHPLWLVLISPLYLVAGADPDLPIHLALTLATVLSAATAGFAYAITRRLTKDALAAAFTLLLYAFNPMTAIESLNGLETALSGLCVAATVWYWLRSRDEPSFSSAALLGVLAGIAILARTDNVFLLGAMLIAILCRGPAGIRQAILTGSVAAFCIVPWLIWSAMATGSVIQTSGLAVPFVLHGNDPLGADWGALLMSMASGALAGSIVAIRYSGGPWLFTVGLIAVILVGLRDRQVRGELAQLNFLAAAILLLVVFHGAYRFYPRGWYFAAVGLLVSIYAGAAFARLHALCSRRSAGMAAGTIVVGVVLLGAIQFRALWVEGLYPWQPEMVAAAEWVGAHTGAAQRVGAFNAGIIAYWNPERTVINLDGVVNGAAFDAIRERRLWTEIRATDVAYLLDYEKFLFGAPADFSFAYAPYIGVPLAEHVRYVSRLPGSYVHSDFVILEVRADSPTDVPRTGAHLDGDELAKLAEPADRS